MTPDFSRSTFLHSRHDIGKSQNSICNRQSLPGFFRTRLAARNRLRRRAGSGLQRRIALEKPRISISRGKSLMFFLGRSCYKAKRRRILLETDSPREIGLRDRSKAISDLGIGPEGLSK